MASVTINELHGDLDHYLRLAQQGEEVIVNDHGAPVATINPILNQQYTQHELNMIADGRMTPAQRPLTREALKEMWTLGAHLPPNPDRPRQYLEALLEDREEDYR